MSYQKKYWFQFTSLDNKVNVVELWQDTATVLTAEEVESMAMPFSVEMPDLDHKFQVVRGTGCEINLLSPTDRKFFDGLYHTQMQEFWIKHWIDDVLNWTGFLNSELVRESYSEVVNYPFQITGNDGFALLDRLQFLQTDGTKYTGIKSQFELIDIATSRMGLFLGDFYLSFSTRFTGQGTASDSSILHETYVDCANFYDEDGVAFTMRKVIEGCLAPYGAFIMQIGGNIWVTDVNTLAQGTAIFKRFECGTGNYFDASEIVLTKDLSDIGYMGTGAEIEMSGGKNKQVISYSPYPPKTILPELLKELAEFSGSIPADFSSRLSSIYYKALSGNTNLTVTSPAAFEQSYRYTGIVVQPEQRADASVCIQWSAGYGNTKIIELATAQTISIGKGQIDTDPNAPTYRNATHYRGVSIVVAGEAQIYSNALDGNIREATIKLVFKIGSRYGTFGYRTTQQGFGSHGRDGIYPASVTDNWFDTIKWNDILISKRDNSNIAGVWVPFSAGFINSEDLSGQIYCDFYSQLDYIEMNGTVHTDDGTQQANIRIRNLSISIKSLETGKELSDVDIEHIGYLDKTVKEEAEKIELICGTDSLYIDRGKLMYLSAGSYISIKEWTRSLQSFKIEELLLNSLSSNYTMGYLTISNLKLTNTFNQLNLITDAGLITAKNFMVKSKRVNFRDNLIEATIVEIQPDSLTIVPYV
jgi:hypothetical protein